MTTEDDHRLRRVLVPPFDMVSDRIEEWLSLAGMARRLAKNATQPEIVAMLLSIAEEYEAKSRNDDLY